MKKNNGVTLDSFPELLKEWNPAKNKHLSFKNITAGSNKKVWWKCKKGHEWEANVSSRTEGRGCPYCCIGPKRIDGSNCLAVKFPHVVSEWNHDKNVSLTPHNIAPKSNKKVWWKCKKGHEWECIVANRTQGLQNCPYCSGKRACSDNCIVATHYELSKEWHPTRNGELSPSNFVEHSHKKVWWKCSKGHEWKTAILHRTSGQGCPYCCIGPRKADKGSCIATVNLKLSKEWHPTKNGKLCPSDVTAGSGKKVWWQCLKCKNEWQTSIYQRSNGSACPMCSAIVLKDGEACASLIEAYFYLCFKDKSLLFFHDKKYGGRLGNRRYDFYFPLENKYVEVTSYTKGARNYFAYLRNIVVKKRYVKNVLKAKFEFIGRRLSPTEKAFVIKHIS